MRNLFVTAVGGDPRVSFKRIYQFGFSIHDFESFLAFPYEVYPVQLDFLSRMIDELDSNWFIAV